MMNFIDFSKSFDIVHRQSMWVILKTYGIPSDIITIIQNVYEDNQSSSKVAWTVGQVVLSDYRSETTYMSPSLFVLVLDWIMKKALNGLFVSAVGQEQQIL